MHPLPGDAAIVEHYRGKFADGNYELLRRFAHQYEVVYRGFLDMVRHAFASQGQGLKGLKVMEVGCFTADFLALAAAEGCDVVGFELQDQAVALAQQRLPGRVHQIDVHDSGLDGATYDAVCLFGLIEHVRDPMGLLARCCAMLRPGGWIFLQTPNRGSIPARLLGRYWPPNAPVEQDGARGRAPT
jgi:2-polyprenyl-3-methyl-5-hydroxy-6-metoxy-1,4-benzoquinol methylase